jgi:hypothetical protein
LRAQASGASDNTLRLWRVSPRVARPLRPCLFRVASHTWDVQGFTACVQNRGWGVQGGAEMAVGITAPPAPRRVQEPKKQSEYGGVLLRPHHQHGHSTSALA